jgi:hypothetical protein
MVNPTLHIFSPEDPAGCKFDMPYKKESEELDSFAIRDIEIDLGSGDVVQIYSTFREHNLSYSFSLQSKGKAKISSLSWDSNKEKIQQILLLCIHLTIVRYIKLLKHRYGQKSASTERSYRCAV